MSLRNCYGTVYAVLCNRDYGALEPDALGSHLIDMRNQFPSGRRLTKKNGQRNSTTYLCTYILDQSTRLSLVCCSIDRSFDTVNRRSDPSIINDRVDKDVGRFAQTKLVNELNIVNPSIRLIFNFIFIIKAEWIENLLFVLKFVRMA